MIRHLLHWLAYEARLARPTPVIRPARIEVIATSSPHRRKVA